MYELLDKLEQTRALSKEEWTRLISQRFPALATEAAVRARKICDTHYGHQIYIRGLIEFTNYCRNDCYYCGIRRSNANVRRYRLSEDDILDCCQTGYELGFRTFVLQGGEDAYFTDQKMISIVSQIKTNWPDCAITLSIGEKSRATYEALYEAGADRYLLRHETRNDLHYGKLHPASLSAPNRRRCLRDLKEIGFQTGSGFMVGSPFQTPEHLAEDMLFLKELDPHMVGIGPFIPHHDTPFKDFSAGTLELTLYLLSLLRLMLPKVLLPATTALGTIHPQGRELGIKAGANVVMPNLSPRKNRKDYSLYDDKICTGEEAAECRTLLEQRMDAIGFKVVTARGDSLALEKPNKH